MLDNYRSFQKDMILRDYLALDRTVLANERTLLAYLRTAIGLLAGGFGLVQLLDTAAAVVIGWSLMIIAPFFLVVGVYRYFKTRKKLKTLDTGGIGGYRT